MRRALGIAASLLWITNALAQGYPISVTISGKAFYDRCNIPEDPQKQVYCLGYVAGTSDVLNLTRSVCTPEGIHTSQTLNVIVNYVRAHPERRDEPVSLLAGLALREAFPCKNPVR